MATDQRLSGLRRVLSRWRRDAATVSPQSVDENDEPRGYLRPTNSDGQQMSLRTYSTAVLAGQKWRAKMGMTSREQMGHSVLELLALEPAGAQLMPIHEAARQGKVNDVRTILSRFPHAKNLRDSRQATALHHAAAEGFVEVVELLIEQNSDLNAKDEHGETPLHWAITCEKVDIIEFLVAKEADVNIVSGAMESPLHTAVRLQNPEIVRTLLKFPEVDVNKPGEHGRRPLHLAATLDSIDIIEQLLARGALPCAYDANGMRPLQLTARCGGKRHVMEHLLKIAQELLGYPQELVVNFKDADGMTALHHAVSGANVEVAKLLLERGCKLLDPESSAETAFHLACSQGSLEMVKAIMESCGLPTHEVLSAQDATGQTPLHKAAIFNHTETVKYLIELGADINAPDKYGRTALLLSAQAGATGCVRFLLSNGADAQVRDVGLRNVLHVAIQYGQQVAEAVLGGLTVSRSLLDEQDAHGLTPLHYASKMGNLKPVEWMLDLGATPNPKNNQHQSPLHFAAKYGRYQTAKRLLQGPGGKQMINEEDRVGHTALHFACKNGFPRLVELLLSQGALVLKCRQGINPVHSAATGGYVECIAIILASHPYVLDWTSNDGDTALHKAATAGHPKIVEYLLSKGAELVHNKAGESFFDIAIDNKITAVALTALQHDRWREAMDLVNRDRGYPMLKLIETMPDVAKVVLDRSVTTAPLFAQDKDFWRNYDFKYLVCEKSDDVKEDVLKSEKTEQMVPGSNDADTVTLADEQEMVPVAALDKMVKYDRKDLLLHPVSSALLKSRWKSYGSLFFILNTLLYVIYVIALTSAVALMVPLVTDTDSKIQNLTTRNQTENQTDVNKKTLSHFGYFCQFMVVILADLQLLKEIIQMFQLRLNYFTDLTNYLEWTLYITSILFVVPTGSVEMDSYRIEMGAVAIFLSWIILLLYMQRIDVVGIYIVMFMEVLKTLLFVMSVFFVFIVAFGLTFYVLLYPAEPYFSSVSRSYLKMGEFMLGELDFQSFFDLQDRNELHHPVLTWILILIVLIFLPIIFMNLLIGLAVGDIEGVRKNAQLKRLAMQVELYTETERKLPKSIKKRVCKPDMKEYPNRGCSHSWFDFSQVGSLLLNLEESDSTPETAELREKLEQNETKLKDISDLLEKQHELLRAIMQKMEIKTEAEGRDEGMPLAISALRHTTHL